MLYCRYSIAALLVQNLCAKSALSIYRPYFLLLCPMKHIFLLHFRRKMGEEIVE